MNEWLLPRSTARLQWVKAILLMSSFGLNTLERGELARSLEILSLCHRYLLWMARLVEASTAHWPTPSRRLEQEVSQASYERFAQCTAFLERAALHRAYGSAWTWGVEMMTGLAQHHRLGLPVQLFDLVTQRIDVRNKQG